MTTIPSKFYYISSGAKNAMRTLRHVVSVPGAWFEDTYICNLARDYDVAVEKARGIIGTSAVLESSFTELDKWGDKLKPWMKSQIAMIASGIMPFGKFVGQEITSLDEGYIKYWVKQSAQNPVSQTLVQKFIDIANERDLFAKWEKEETDRVAAREEQLSKMDYVGKIGKRMDVFLRCDKVLSFTAGGWGYNVQMSYMNICVDRFGNKFVYKGSNAWEEGKYYKATVMIKDHKEYKGEKQTIINRPKVHEVVTKDAK